MTYPGGQPDPQQPHQQPYEQAYQQPYEQPTSYQQPIPAQPYTQPAYGPPAGGGDQRGGRWALIIGGGVLALILLVVGGYFAFQQVFVHTPTEVVEAYLDEATKPAPDPSELEQYLCDDEAAKLKKDLSNSSGSTSSSSSTVLDWHVTGETIRGNTATVYTQFTIKSSSGRTSTNTLNLTLIKEDGWKICGYDN